jgi:DNA-directed RNA polymerase specialized sigma54-like protein
MSRLINRVELKMEIGIFTYFLSARMQSQSGSAHSPHRIRKIIMKEWKKSLKFHRGTGSG